MDKITFCIPSKSNLRYLKTCIPSIRKNAYRKDHDIIIFVDSDEDGTVEWLGEVKNKYNIQYYVNPKLGEELYGIGMAYDCCIEKSTTDIFMIFHADMILGKDADLKAFNHLKSKTVVCATRIEPPLHPNGGEKVLEDFGMWPEEFKETEFNQYIKDRVEQFIQSWESFVYHFTGRGAGSFDGDEERHKQWQEDMNKSTLEFVRKWGQNVNHTPLMKPIVYPVYNKSVKINNPNPQLSQLLEPWFNNQAGILVEIDGNNFTQQDFQLIQQLSAIIKDSGEIGEFNLGNLKITINSLTTYEKDLIKCQKKKY